MMSNQDEYIMVRNTFLAFLLFLCSDIVYAQKYKNPVGKEFPIVAWYALDREHNTNKDYQMMADAGFNLSLSFFSSYKDVLQGLSECEGTGVKLISYCWELWRKTGDFIPMVKDNANLAFYYTSDEPTQDDFKELKRIIDERRNYDSKHQCYVYLQPNYATLEQLKSISYEDYIESYISTIKPSMLSFDYYPFRYTGFREGYYGNLNYISNVCQKNKIPFWGFVMSSTDSQYPVTKESYLRFQVAMNLAFGAKGIQYFTYSIPSSNYTSAIVDSEFVKTEIYDVVKKINSEIHRYSSVWLNSKIKNIWYVGPQCPEGLKTDYKSKKIKNITTDNKGFIISEFKSKGKYYLLVVNIDTEQAQTLNIEFKKTATLVKGEAPERSIAEKISVAPGDYILIRI